MHTEPIPKGLPFWFVVHFAADLIFALPLMIAPELFLTALGWTAVDPVSARLVGAALLGIGGQSLIGRRESASAFRAMLNLKIIWSLSACLGFGLSLAQGAPVMTWAFLAIFASFSALWMHYRWKLHAPTGATA